MKIFKFLLLLSPLAFAEESTLPHTLSNGEVADAEKVMDNFNVLLSESARGRSRIEALEDRITADLRNLGLGGGLKQTIKTNNFNGNENTAFGFHALLQNTEGYRNTAVGSNALVSNTTGSLNTALGHRALEASVATFSNTALGARTLFKNTTGDGNTAVGHNALSYNESGQRNVALGEAALQLNTSGEHNVAVGAASLTTNTTGIRNSAVGHIALLRNETGIGNSAFGYGAIVESTAGDNNTALGYLAMYSGTAVNGNTAVGMDALRYLKQGENNTVVGLRAGAADPNTRLTNAMALGANARVNASNKIQLGDGNVTAVATAGKLTTGAVTYPNTHGAPGQVLGTNGAGELVWFNRAQIAQTEIRTLSEQVASLKKQLEAQQVALASQEADLLDIVRAQQRQIALLQRMAELGFSERFAGRLPESDDF